MPDFQIDIKLLPKWQLDVLVLSKLCGQKILVVTDGLNYDPNDGFGLTELIKWIGQTPAFGAHTISTADRFGDPNATIPGSFNFSTAVTPVTRANYDQLWLFGVERTNLVSAAERRVIAQFMEDGGGVFATGDHENLGFAMCADLPRIRKMREWTAIPVGGTERIDTIPKEGIDAGFQFSDQSDNVPQQIFPHFTGTAPNFVAHPLLRRSGGVIDVMPDHPHESVCLIPTDFGQVMSISGKNFTEYPTVSGVQPRPVPVSTSVSGGRFLTDQSGKPPVTPRCFLGITAYDGDAANVGRIVCDSTWHHFININLNGKDSGIAAKKGFLDAMNNPDANYLQIIKYFQNIVKWLAPKNTRNCWIFTDIIFELYRYPLKEEIRPIPHPCPWDPLVRIGKLVSDAIDRRHGRGRAAEIVEDLLAIGGVEPAEREAFRMRGDEKESHLLPLDELQLGLLGSVVNTIALELPANPNELKSKFKTEKGFAEFSRKFMPEGINRGLDEAAKGLAGRIKNSAKLLERLTKNRVK